MILSRKVMQGEVPRVCLLVATLALGPAWAGPCERGRSWWNRTLGACEPCTRCDPQRHRVVKYPCELHRDTVCQPLADVTLRGAWPADYDYYEYADDAGDGDGDSDVKLVLQASTLTLAVSGCVVFFLVVLLLSLHHAKQWRVLKQALKSDVRDLSAKLKLVEAGLENPAEPGLPADHHIYCNIQMPKDALLDPPSCKKGSGNVYTQEKHPT